jgi:hypothetical protein
MLGLPPAGGSFITGRLNLDSFAEGDMFSSPLAHDSFLQKLTVNDSTYDPIYDVVPPQQFNWAGCPRVTMYGSDPYVFTHVKPIPALVTGGVYFGVLTWLHFYQKRTFWSSTASFRAVNNPNYALDANYGGHFTAGYFLSYLSTESLVESGFGLEMSTILGTIMGESYQYYVEIMDGYGADWGFSAYKITANTLGAAMYLASYYSPFLQNFNPKADYFPAPWYGDKPRNPSQTPIDDYSAWTFWMSVNVHNLLPESAQNSWPSWLNIAIGNAARNLGYPDQQRVNVIGLDFNLARILPEGGSTWNWIRQSLAFIMIPGPAFEIKSHAKPQGYVFYPFNPHFTL